MIRGTHGEVILRTHVDPVRLSPDDAGRLLRGLKPILQVLETVARSVETASGSEGSLVREPGVRLAASCATASAAADLR